MQSELLKRILKERNFSQKKLARELAVSESHISKILKGERFLGVNKAMIAAKMLNVPLENFFQKGKSLESNRPI